jgi:cytochrome P450
VQRQLRLDPEQVPVVLEELLRLHPVVPPARTLTQDFTLGGVSMKAGDTVLLATSAASRDPQSYESPRQLEFGRAGAWTTAFGMGPHRCIGSHLARQELTIVLQLVLEMLPQFELAGSEPKWHTAGNLWRIDALRLRFKR